MGYMGESASKSLVYASQNEMNVMLNDLNANNSQYSIGNEGKIPEKSKYYFGWPNFGSRFFTSTVQVS